MKQPESDYQKNHSPCEDVLGRVEDLIAGFGGLVSAIGGKYPKTVSQSKITHAKSLKFALHGSIIKGSCIKLFQTRSSFNSLLCLRKYYQGRKANFHKFIKSFKLIEKATMEKPYIQKTHYTRVTSNDLFLMFLFYCLGYHSCEMS